MKRSVLLLSALLLFSADPQTAHAQMHSSTEEHEPRPVPGARNAQDLSKWEAKRPQSWLHPANSKPYRPPLWLSVPTRETGNEKIFRAEAIVRGSLLRKQGPDGIVR
jgi:hypothetical protein